MGYLIYRVINDKTGKSYIGLTSRTFEERISEHIQESGYNSDNTYFHNSIRKYGISLFSFEIIQEKIDGLELASFWEKYYIKKYDTFLNGYNLTKGGHGISGFKHSEETKKMYSEMRKGNKYKLGKKEKEITKAKKKKRSKENNSTAKHINIYNENCELVHECFSNFKSICINFNLPYTPLYKSYRNSGVPILINKNGYSKEYLRENEKYIGWFAKEEKDFEKN